MDEEILQNYLKAGKIASAVREESRKFIKPGMTLLDIAEKIEKLITDNNALPAFPVNLSLNQKAAHYTPPKNDRTVFTKDDVLKVDIGVSVDGFIGDTAYTITTNTEYNKLVKASEEALKAALELSKPNMQLSKLSEAIENTIKSFGFNPIANLTGHGLDFYDLHADPQVPNIKINADYKLSENQVIAIEPFATTGIGMVKDTTELFIFSSIPEKIKPIRNADARKILDFVSQFNGLPFAQRWLEKSLNMSEFKIKIAMREMLNNDIINPYPVLSEVGGGIVSQAEHTVIIRDEPIITTK